jgi:hypothetical protein
MSDVITIRRSVPDDRPAILRLAALDGRDAPDGPMLLALVGGELRAALPVSGGEPLADPFHRTGGLVLLLRVRAEQHRQRPQRLRLALAGR